MERYEEYKDSGVERIGEIPAEWEAARLKTHLVKNQGGVWGSDPRGDGGTVVLRSTEQTVDGNWDISDPAIRDLSEESDADSRILEEGDLLVTKSSGSALHIGKTTIVDEAIASMRCSYSNFMQRLRSGRGLTSRFCWYLLNSDLAREQYCYLQNSTSGLGNLTSGTISGIMIPVPPVDDQEAIVSYLDAKTAEVDSLVKDCEREVELLQEYRKAVVSEAVTKGLDPNAPMKDSGIDWIGEIPEGWEVSKVKYAYINRDSERVPVEASKRDQSAEVLYPYYGASGVVDFISDFIFDEPLLLIGEDGANLRLRNLPLIYAANGRYWVNNHAHILQPTEMMDYRYSFYQLELVDLENYLTGSTQPKLTAESLGLIPVAMPSMREQQEIAAYLDVKTAEIDSFIADYRSIADKLHEYRKSLISEAVTGKFKVPGVA